jgi:hypothetical protein
VSTGGRNREKEESDGSRGEEGRDRSLGASSYPQPTRKWLLN